MPKFKADTNVGSGARQSGAAASADDHTDSDADETEVDAAQPDFTTTVATIGVIGVAAALFDVALIPGIIIGVAAAYAPKYLCRRSVTACNRYSTTRSGGAYKVTRKARSAVAETQERFHDLAAEVEAEEAAELNGAAPAHAAS